MAIRTTLAAILLVAAAPAARADGDAAAGRTVFQKCAPCHSVEAGVNRLGPNLHGIVGRRWGSVEGFAYSPALRAADRRWDAASLDGYLADPKGFAPGTRMIFAGLKDAKDRQELIAYLATLP